MTPAHARRIEALKFADSYTRMGCLLALRRYPDFWSHVGREWSCCDNIANHFWKLVLLLHEHRERHGFPIIDAMDDDAQKTYAALPEVVTVWRGAYSHNVRGISWSLDHETAARFPFLHRYRRDGAIDRALLIEGRIPKDRIAFLVTDRGEHEVVLIPFDVEIVGQSLAFDALDDDERNRMFPAGRAAA